MESLWNGRGVKVNRCWPQKVRSLLYATMYIAIRATVRSTTIAAVLFLLLLTAWAVAAQPAAHFEGRVITEWLEHDGDDRTMRLVEPFVFRDSNGREWVVPATAVVDGASIPPLLWSIIGPPFVGDYRRASVVHDHFCRTMSRPWQKVHRMFFDAAIAGGVPTLQAKVYYAALRAAGKRWEPTIGLEPGAPRYVIATPDVSEDALAGLQEWVIENDPTLAQVELQADRIARQ